MSAPRVFHQPLLPGLAALSENESHHLANVLRMRPGQTVTLFDGAGGEAKATFIDAVRKTVNVRIDTVEHRPFSPTIRLTLAVAWPRVQRQTFMIEKTTELGVWSIWPTIFERSVVKPRASHTTRWLRTAVEACKQCERTSLPQINPPMTFNDTLEHASEFDQVVMASPDDDAISIIDLLTPMLEKRRDVTAAPTMLVWIGPEGGLSPVEMQAAVQAGARPARLNRNILRIETAAIAVAAVIGSFRP